MIKLFIQTLIFTLLLSAKAANSSEVSVFGDALVWHASQEATSTWASVVSIPASGIIDFDATDVDFGWNTGFRVGAEYKPKYLDLDTRLYWTHFNESADNSVRLGLQVVLPEFFSGFTSGNTFFGADMQWHLMFNMVDVDIGRQIKFGKRFAVRPYAGVKSGTINQKINCIWDAVIFQSQEHVKHNYYGIGPKFGIDARWAISKRLGVAADLFTAFMWGRWKVEDTYKRPLAAGGLVTPTTIVTTNANKNFLGTVTIGYFLGLDWIYKSNFELEFKVGYEMQYWANQLRLLTFQQLPTHGSLTLQGGTCHIRLGL